MGTAVNMDVVILGCRYAEIQGYKEIVICKICASGIEYKDLGECRNNGVVNIHIVTQRKCNETNKR